MKLGEALTLRARQAQKLNDLQGRIVSNVTTQEGTDPSESPRDLISSYLTVSDEHSDLVRRIALTNAAERADGTRLIDLLQERERKQRARNIWKRSADTATPSRDAYRFTRTELKYVAQIDVPTARDKADALDAEIRTIDAKLQQLNWETELL